MQLIALENIHGSTFQAISNNYFLPEENVEIMPGVKWGNYCQLYTPAFWKYLYLNNDFQKEKINHKLGNTVIEEIVACLLGGFGMPAELCLAAFERLKNEQLIKEGVSLNELQTALKRPLKLNNGKFSRYRFYNQKSRFIYTFLNRNDLRNIPLDNDLNFRNWLLTIDGIGHKTASWITRNWLHSENVAILDIHLLRAGKIAGFFKHQNVVSKYIDLENSFISFCKAIDVLPSNMDAIIWDYMKKSNKLALKFISNSQS